MSSRYIGSREPHLRPPSCRIQHRKSSHSDRTEDSPCEDRDGKALYSSLIACKSQCSKRKLGHSDRIGDSPCEERDGKPLYPTLIACKRQRTKRASSLSKFVGIQLLDDDTLIEILSRLSLEFVPILKCVCKRWLHLTNSNSFRNAHFRKSKNGVAGIYLQGMLYCICCEDVQDYPSSDFVGIDKEGRRSALMRNYMLDFLPEKVVVAASSNGLIICRSFFRRIKDHTASLPMENPPRAELVIYVCNPLTKEFRVLKPKLGNKDRCGLGFAFTSTYFQVLVVQVVRKANDNFCYIFKIFSSKTNTWRVSKEKCYHSHRLLYQRQAFVNGLFYWLALGHSLVAFNLEKERCHILKLPGPVVGLDDGACGWCLGVSEGKLHYVVSTLNEFMVWILTGDYLNPEWQLKYFRNALHYRLVSSEEWKNANVPMDKWFNYPSQRINPMAFKDDVVFLDWGYNFTTLNIKTGHIEELSRFGDIETRGRHSPFVVPYSKSLLPVFNN